MNLDETVRETVREEVQRFLAEQVSPPCAEYLSVREAATYLGLSKAQLDIWRSKGVGGPPWYKHGHLVKYRRSELDAWMAPKRRAV